MIKLNEIIEVINQDFEGDVVDYGEVTEIISDTLLIVNLQSDTSLYCKVRKEFGSWYIIEDVEVPLDIKCRF